jgi:hypothetical protein
MTIVEGSTLPTTSVVSELRLLWAPAQPGWQISGIWWPYSRDIDVELAALLPAADEHLHAPLTRVWLNPSAWDHQPHMLYDGKRVIHLAWFPSIEPETVGIGPDPLTRITLCVVPPELPESAGEQIFSTLGDGQAWPTEPSELLRVATP